MGILVPFQIGVSVKRSVPALKRCTSLRCGTFFGSGGRAVSVTKIVTGAHSSVWCVNEVVVSGGE
jgi:hypothetical protein